MKKVILVTGVAVLALASVAAAAAPQPNLTVGSTGAQVSALQTWLISKGFDIPAISAGTANKGYFGSQTKAAVAAYQKSVGLPAYGFYGPLTEAAINADTTGPVAVTPVACPAGYTCTANPVTTPVVCPAGVTCTPNPGTTGTVVGGATGISTPGVPGTLATSLWTSPSNGTVVYKGQSYDVVAVKAQAAASDMAVQSVSLDFSARLWLYASSITLKDDTGAIIGQVNNLNASNFSELSVGSDYRITIPVSNYVVKATQTRYITANVTFLATSDRDSGLVGVSSVQVRAVDGTGVTDTETVNTNTSDISTTTDANGVTVIRTFNYQGSGAGSVVVTVDGSSPLAGLVQMSTGGQTNDVPLAIYDIKSQNAPGQLQKIIFTVNTHGTAKTPSDLFSQYNLKVNGTTYGAQDVSVSGQTATVTFSNFGNITLPADQYVPVSLTANVQQDTNNALDGTMATTSLVVNSTNLQVVDQSFKQLSLNTGTFLSSELTFSASSATVSNLVASLGSAIVKNNTTTGYGVNFGFTMTAGNNTLYIAANPAVALATSSSGFGADASSTLPFAGVNANPSNLSGDSSNPPAIDGYYVIPAGQSRAFTYAGSVDNTNGVSGLKSFSITSINYGTSTTALTGGTINYNLGTLKVNPTF
jgi:peptidoglycan hydrolase-like protein with peptidoglycan-binding domain